jgi:tetratricopeptide (TPR) repeat protein
VDAAATWYRNGHDAAERIPNAPEDVKDLWAFRWEHAEARIAARRGDKAGAAGHMAAAKAVLDRGRIAQQAPFYPYLTGYVAFYEGDFTKAAADLGSANQNDPFILALQAQAFEKSGNAARAKELYRKALASTAHNPANAFARPLAKARLETP